MDRRKVMAQYEAVRRLGQANMLDKDFVQRIAYENEFYELVCAIEEDYGSILKSYSNWVTLVAEQDIPIAIPVSCRWERDEG